MALKRNERYPGRFNNPTTGHPQGAFKNRTSPTAQDGSYLESDWANDWSGFFESLLSAANVTPDGNVDAVGASQYFNALGVSMGGRLIKITPITASSSYTPDSKAKKLLVYVTGGGGGGGGSAATDANTRSCGGGGGAGCTVVSMLNVADITFPVNIVIGSAGAAGAAGGSPGGSGGAGGATLFGSVISSPGGFGGGGGTLTNDTVALVAPNGGSSAQPTIGNVLNMKGSAGLPGVIGGNAIVSGAGGASFFGGGGNPISAGVSTSGDKGVLGGGGSGGISIKSSAVGSAGGVGGTGVVWVWEYV